MVSCAEWDRRQHEARASATALRQSATTPATTRTRPRRRAGSPIPTRAVGTRTTLSDDKKTPKVALPGNKPAPPYWILAGEKEPFDDSKYKAGDEVPAIIVGPFTGDRGDISAKIVYKDGVRTSVFWRKLATGSEYDVQFSDLKNEYAFGVAVFDN